MKGEDEGTFLEPDPEDIDESEDDEPEGPGMLVQKSPAFVKTRMLHLKVTRRLGVFGYEAGIQKVEH